MPEEQKITDTPTEATAENGTGTNSPTKSPVSKGKLALAKITLLDGTVRDFYIDVSIQKCFVYSYLLYAYINESNLHLFIRCLI